MADSRWLRSEPVPRRKQTWKPQVHPTLVAPVGTGQGDSEYGPFDPYNYGADPSLLPAQSPNPWTPREQTLDPWGTGPQPGDFPESPPTSPTHYLDSPSPQPPEDPAQGAPPGLSEPQGAVQADTRGWAGQVSDAAGGWSRGLADALGQVPQAAAGALDAASRLPIVGRDWEPTKRGSEALAEHGGEALRKLGQAASDFVTDPMLERNRVVNQQPGQEPPRRQSFVEPVLEGLSVIPKTVGAMANTVSGQPLTSPEGKPMGAGDILEPFVDPLPGAGAVLAAAGRAPDLINHVNPAIRATQRMLKETDPAGPPLADWVGNIRKTLVQHFTDRGVHLAKAQELAQKALDLKQMPDGLNPYELQRLMPDPAAEQHVIEGLKPIAQQAGELYDALAHVLVNNDNVDKARMAGIHARDEVLRSGPEPKISMELEVDRRRAGQAIENLEAQLADANDLVHNPPPGVSVAQQLRNEKAADDLGLKLNAAQDRFNTLNAQAQMQEVAYEQALRHKAAAAQGDAEMGRVFSGGVNVADSEGALQILEAELGPQQWTRLQTLAQQAWSYADGLRERMLAGGLWKPERVEYFRQNFPHYVPTNIMEHIPDAPSPYPTKKSLSVTDDLVDRLSIGGTEKAREDPLAALERATYQTERAVRRNQTFNAFLQVRNASPQLRALIREVPTAGRDVLADLTPEEQALRRAEHRDGERLLHQKDYVALRGFVNGDPVTYAMPKTLAEAIQGEPNQLVGGAFGNAIRALNWGFIQRATLRFPAFLVSNASLDAMAYTIREAARSGSPIEAARAPVDLALAYFDLFFKPGSGITRNELTGEASQFLKSGGGYSGFYSGSAQGSRPYAPKEFKLPFTKPKPPDPSKQQVSPFQRNIQRGNVFEIKNPGDAARMTKDLLSLKWVEALGGRVEMAPRLAAYRRAKRRGLSETNATIAGRDVTIDFARGGDTAKMINQFLPFFNVAIQGAVTPTRALKANPAGTIISALGLVGLPTMAAEAWNLGHNPDGSYDPQRAKDYANVPNDVKQQGIVLMLPNNAPVDAEGNRKPEYVYARLREWAFAANIAREVAARIGGSSPTGWQELLGQVGSQALPVHGPSDLIPWYASTPTELVAGKNLWSNRDITTERTNERASALGQALAPPLTAAAQWASGNPYNKVHPSQIDFAARGLGAGIGTMALGISDMVAGRRDPEAAGITSAPVIGGLASRFMGNRTGQRLFDISDNPLPIDTMKVLRDAGIDTKPAAPPDTMTVPGLPGTEFKMKPEQREEYNRIFQVVFNNLYASMPDAAKTNKEALAGVLSEARKQTSDAFPMALTPEQVVAQTTFDGKPPTEQQKLAIELATDLRDPRRFPEYVNPQTGQAEGGPEEWAVWDQALKTKQFNGVPLTETQLAGLRDRKREALTKRNLQLFQIDVSPQGAVTAIRPKDPRYEHWNRYFGTFQGIDDVHLQAWKDGRRARYVNPQTGAQVTPEQSDMMDRWLRMYRDSRVGSKLRAALRPKALVMQKWATPDWKNQLRMIDEAELQEEAGVIDAREQQFAGTAP